MSYLGRSAKLSLKAQEKVSFLATAGQTVKTGLSYTPSFIEVYVNGVLLTDTTDFTATNGNSITFTVALLLNDEVTVISLKTFTVADHYTKSDADTLLAAKATNTALATTNTAVALKAPIASPVFTGGIDVTGSSSTFDSVSGDLSLYLTTGAVSDKSQLIFGDGATSLVRMGVGGTAGDIISDSQGQDFNIRTAAGGRAINFSTNNGASTEMKIDNGQVQIGSPSASSAWLLNLKALSGGSTVRLQSNNGYDAISFLNASGSQCGWIRSNASSVAYNSSSDYRLKTDVQPMTGATDRVKLLKPCNFEWIVDGTRVDGFLAHEAQEVVPESVTGTKDAMMDEEYEVTAATDTEAAVMGTRSVPDMQGIDQSKLVPLLTATIQELISRIEALEGE